MITLGQGNLLRARAEALVNTVNCVGVMGRGVALQFRRAFPQNYEAYKRACERNEVQIGKMFCVELPISDIPRVIINFPTKRHWREPSKLAYIEAGLVDLVRVINELDIRSIALPPLGCGLGGLDWSEVRPRIEDALTSIEGLEIVLFEPTEAVEPKAIVNRTEPPAMTPGSAVVLTLMGRYLAGLMDPTVTLLEIHKLMYFMQSAGQPLRLVFSKGHYGPYAENLRHVLDRLEDHFISGYGDGGDNPRAEIEVKDHALSLANQFLENNDNLQSQFRDVERLIDGYETPFGLELLSTVHWVATQQGARNPQEAVAEVHNWNRRKHVFTDKHVATAWNNLQSKGWLPTH